METPVDTTALQLAPTTSMGTVTLLVGDLDRMSSYYEHALALEPLAEHTASSAPERILGRGGTPLVKLVARPELPVGNPREAGLFHNAFLFETQASLAATVARAARDPRSRFVGAADHLVSEAFYFTDPEGNGIELYWDRPRDTWRVIDGQTQMDTLPLDPNAYLARHLEQAKLDAPSQEAASVGHVHLQVGDLARARAFYVDALGFQVSFDRISRALFVAAGGYHHHMAMNTWNSAGAGPRAASLGLGEVSITVAQRSELDEMAERLRAQGVQFADRGDQLVARDPWNTRLAIGLADRPTGDLFDSAL